MSDINWAPDNPEEKKEPEPEQSSGSSAEEKNLQQEEADRKIRVYVEPGAKKDTAEGSSEQADFMMGALGGPKIYKIGDKVTGKVVQVKEDSLVVNIGTKNEGIVPREELSYVPNPTTEQYEPGQEIDMVVIRQGDDDTYYLSKKRAEEDKAWKAVEEAYANNARLNAVGSQVVNAGIILDMGIRGFMPLSHSDIKRIDPAELIGKEFEVKVLEFNRDSRPQRLVVSRRAVLEEDLTRERDELYEKFKPGDVVTGKVEKLTNFGAFINLGGVTGLLHISQMSRRRISDPSEVVKVGDEIEVKIIDVDREKKKIRLSRRDLLSDPWDEIERQYRPGDVIEGVVVRVTSFGAFIKIDNYFEGLAHISELVDNKINHAKEVFSPGDRVPVMILEVDTQRKRIRLSAKKAVEKQARREVDAFLKDQEDIRNTLRIPTEALEAALAAPEAAPETTPEEPAPETEAAPPAVTEILIVEETAPTAEPESPKVEEPVSSMGLDEAPPETAGPEPEPDSATPEPEAVAEEPAVEAPEETPGLDAADDPPAASTESDDDRELISGEEFDDTGQPDLGPSISTRHESEEIDLIEGNELDDK